MIWRGEVSNIPPTPQKKTTLKKPSFIRVNDFYSKCEQIRKYLKICSYLLKKFLMENITFSAAYKANMRRHGNIA